METLSYRFMEALVVPRDRLYGVALARAGGAGGAEAALQGAARAVFRAVAVDAVTDIAGAMERELGKDERRETKDESDGKDERRETKDESDGKDERRETKDESAGQDAAVMPADVWARLAAAVQLEAAQSSHAAALAPDSVLLKPDPMLAPKRGRPRAEPPDFDVSTPRRLLALVGLALVVGVVVTIYILTRPGGAGGPGRVPGATGATGAATR